MSVSVLLLLDHSGLSAYDSIFEIVNRIGRMTDVSLHLATSFNTKNYNFFNGNSDELVTVDVRDPFNFENRNEYFKTTNQKRLADFQLVFIRLDPPLDNQFLSHLKRYEDQVRFINSPGGMQETATKAFLTHFSHLIPGFAVCKTKESMIAEAQKGGDHVFKPLYGLGGKGLVAIRDKAIWDGPDVVDADLESEKFADIADKTVPAVRMDFLPNIDQGDKRIVVFNGVVLGALLRLPAQGGWLANLAQGGTVVPAEVSDVEHQMIKEIDHKLQERGIYLYGIDTLMGNDGHRVLSEINTANVGGLVQISKFSDRDLWQTFEDEVSKIIDKSQR